jgi:hypothetical protein
MKILITALLFVFVSCGESETRMSEKVSDSEVVYDGTTVRVYKIKVDGIEYLMGVKGNGGIALIKHEVEKSKDNVLYYDPPTGKITYGELIDSVQAFIK